MAEITVHFVHSVFSFVLYTGDVVVFLRIRLYVLCDHVRLQHCLLSVLYMMKSVRKQKKMVHIVDAI